MGKCFKYLVLILVISFLYIDDVRGVGVGGVNMENADVTGGQGCLPAGGHAGYFDIASFRITLVDKDGNKKETHDFLLADKDGNIHYGQAYSNKTTKEVVKEFLNSVLKTSIETRPRRSSLVVIKSYRDDADLDFKVFTGNVESEFLDNIAAKPIILNRNCWGWGYGGSCSAADVLKSQLSGDNADKETIRVIIDQFDEEVNESDYLVIEPIFTWKRSSLLYDNTLGWRNEKGDIWNYCIIGDSVYAYGTPANIFGRESSYAKSLLAGLDIGGEEVRLCSSFYGQGDRNLTLMSADNSYGYSRLRGEEEIHEGEGANCTGSALSSMNNLSVGGNERIWTNDVWFFNTIFSMYVFEDEWSDTDKELDAAFIGPAGERKLFGKYRPIEMSPRASDSNKNTWKTNFYKAYMTKVGTGLIAPTKYAYGMGVVSLKDKIEYCKLKLDNDEYYDLSSDITESNFKSATQLGGDEYCCNVKNYEDGNISVYNKDFSKELFTITADQFSKTSFYEKYCIPKPDQEKYICKEVNGQLYGINGEKVDEEQFEKECDGYILPNELPVIYRTISLDNPFLYKNGNIRPLSKLSNWYDTKKEPVTVGNYREDIINNSKTAYKNNTPKYTINLNVSNIKKIREFNKGNIYSKESNCSFLCKEGSSIGIDINTVKSMGCSC